MDKNELERRLEAAEKQNLGLLDEIKNLKAQIAEMQDEPEIPDIPDFKVVDDEVWYINNILEVSGPCDCPGIVKDYNNFHVKEYADEFANKCKLIAMMLHCKWYLDRNHVPDWKNPDEWKYFVLYNNSKNTFEVTVTTVSDTVAIMFGTEEAAQKCADWLNKHWKENADE